MTEYEQKLIELNQRLEQMVKYQEYFYREINLIRGEINSLRHREQHSAEYVPPRQKNPVRENQEARQQTPPPTTEPKNNSQEKQNHPTAQPAEESQKNFSNERSDLEKFIGENLISKIGIIITVIGVAIGAKYAIDRDLISPLMRIIFGYLFGAGLFGLAVRLKPKYHDFSAVLLSGAMAILYFITFAAHSYYALIPQTVAFALMLVLTGFTVWAAIAYNRQVIAHIGLVGAYAVPFLLGGEPGRIGVLFGYIEIINFGILAVSVKKYWKSIFYTSFIFTWATFAVWYAAQYRSEQFLLAFFFAAIFFLLFYATFLAYKLVCREHFKSENVFLLLANSFVFYGLGYALLNGQERGASLLGLFTLANAAVHSVVALVVNRLKLADTELFRLLVGLSLVFITIAVPVQLDGNWVTLLWTCEAALLFWIGRTRKARLYEWFSYPQMMLAMFSLARDWAVIFDNTSIIDMSVVQTPVFNVYFLTAAIFVAAFAFIERVNANENYESALSEDLYGATRFVFPGIVLIVLYNALRLEIGNYFHWQTVKTAISAQSGEIYLNGDGVRLDTDLNLFNVIWQINYTMLFLTALSFVNIARIKNFALAVVNLALSGFALLMFLTTSLFLLGELRESYLQQAGAEVFARGSFHILIRYISYIFVALLIFSGYRLLKRDFVANRLPKSETIVALDLVFYISLLWSLSSELMNLASIFSFANADKLGLSILWGIYALALVIIGIVQNRKHLRLGAFFLCGITLVKLFFYDIAQLDTISKTIVFVALGVLLLVISFLYNKYKALIFEQNEI